MCDFLSLPYSTSSPISLSSRTVLQRSHVYLVNFARARQQSAGCKSKRARARVFFEMTGKANCEVWTGVGSDRAGHPDPGAISPKDLMMMVS